MPLPLLQSSLLTSDYYATTVRSPTSYHPTILSPANWDYHATAPFFVQPCCRYLYCPSHYMLLPPVLEWEKDQGKGANWRSKSGGARRSEVKKNTSRRGFCFSLWRFRQIFTPSLFLFSFSSSLVFLPCIYFWLYAVPCALPLHSSFSSQCHEYHESWVRRISRIVVPFSTNS